MSCAITPGLSSYPHPWLMPDFWQFPTVSMGLGPINSIYQARFMRYLENRGLIPEDAAQGLGISGRRRDGRAGVARCDHAWLAREARQPDLRRQLQSAAPGWPGARQRQDHPGTGSGVPRRRLERDQVHLERAIGIRFWRKDKDGQLAQAHESSASTANTSRSKPRAARMCRKEFFGQISGNC